MDSDFLFSKQQYTAHTGNPYKDNDVTAYHMQQSFKPGENAPEKVNRIGYELAYR